MPTTRLYRLALALLLSSTLAACGGSGGGGGTPDPAGFLTSPNAILVVQNLNDSGPGSLRQAIEDAPNGSWIHFDPSLSAGTIHFASEIEIVKSVAIGGLTGDGLRMALSGDAMHRLFAVRTGTILQLSDLSIVQGGGLVGGAMYATECTIILWRTQFAGNSSLPGGGGAIHATDTNLLVYDSSFVANTGDYGGALSLSGSNLRMERTSFFLNTATVGNGGALISYGGFQTIVNSSFLSNSAPAAGRYGGAIAAHSTEGTGDVDVDIYSSTITGNHAGGDGGGLAIHSGSGVPAFLQVVRSIVAENTSAGAPDLVALFGANMTGSYNLIGIGDGAIFVDGVHANEVGTEIVPLDPMLSVPLADATGRMYRLPHELSPAVNALDAGAATNPEGAPLLFDQRGFFRDPALQADIGAIER